MLAQGPGRVSGGGECDLMSDSQTPGRQRFFGLFKNWTSLVGAVIILGSIFAFILLFVIDLMAHSMNPYVGILTYLVAPGFTALGFAILVAGMLWRRFGRGKAGETLPTIQIDLSRPRDRKILTFFLGGSVLFLLATAVLSYQTYHFTESVVFCGQACHVVMEPERVTYLRGPHARVACVECHIGPGAGWFVKSKLSGLYQVYATALDKYPRPIPTPIENLRPAKDTCEQCHWPAKFVGNLDRTYEYFLADETNTPYTVRMTMNVGGADPAHGPVTGIHWHVNPGNRVEYIATDELRNTIPWVRMTSADGKVTEFRAPDFTDDISGHEIRTMDCMDCHNRPAHRYEAPSDAVNSAIALGRIDRALPNVKAKAIEVLTAEYATADEAMAQIASAMGEEYPNDPRGKAAIEAVQQIYRNNFFPAMKASWKVYPDHIGHRDWPGCFRCHDGTHVAADGKTKIKANDCNACHTILTQGAGAELKMLTPEGQEFKHPGGDYEGLCNDCHDGTM